MSINRTRSESIVIDHMNLYVSTSGDDTNGDGTSARPWASPHRALSWLSTVTIKDDVWVDIRVAAGAYYFDKALIIDSPNFARVRILGAGASECRYCPQRDYSTNENDDQPEIVPSSTQWYNSAGQLPANELPESSAYPERVERKNARQADRERNLDKIVEKYPTRFYFTDRSAGMEFRGVGCLAYMNNIALIGDGTDAYDDYRNKHNSGVFSDTGYPRTGPAGSTDDVYHSPHKGSLTFGTRVVICDFRWGMRFFGDTTLHAHGVHILNNWWGGVHATGNVNLTLSGGTIQGNGYNGVNVENGRVFLNSTHVCGNRAHGLVAYQGVIMYAYYCRIMGNGHWGILNYGTVNIGGNHVNTNNIVVGGNYSGGLYAQRNAYYGLQYNVDLIGNSGRAIYLDDASVLNFYRYNHDPDYPERVNDLRVENNASHAIEVRDGSTMTINDELTMIPDNSTITCSGGSQIITYASDLDPDEQNNYEFRPPYDTISRDGSYVGPGARAISGPPVVTWQVAKDNTNPINTDGKTVGSVIFVTGNDGGTTYNIPMWAAASGTSGIWKNADNTKSITPVAP